MIEPELHRIIYHRLKNTVGRIVKGVYDFRPQVEDSGNTSAYPVIIFGEDSFEDANTDTTTGAEVQAKIVVYSAAKSSDEAKKICSEIRKAFDRQEEELSTDLVDVISCDVQSVNIDRADRIIVGEVILKLFIDNK
jgi:hypothetical protein